MLKFRVDNKELKVFKDTKFRVEWNHPAFSDAVIPASIVYPFEIPARENHEIFGARYLRGEDRSKKVFQAEVLWMDGSWMRGKLVVQKTSFWRYSAGFVFTVFEDGFGERKVREFLPTVDFLGSMTSILHAFSNYSQGQTWTYIAFNKDYRVDVQCPLMWAKAKGDDFQLRNLIHPSLSAMWRNYTNDPLGLFNKKIISPSLYVKSILDYVFQGWQVRGSWYDDEIVSRLLQLSNYSAYSAQGRYSVFLRGLYKYDRYVTEEFKYAYYVFVPDEIEDVDSVLVQLNSEYFYECPIDGEYTFTLTWKRPVGIDTNIYLLNENNEWPNKNATPTFEYDENTGFVTESMTIHDAIAGEKYRFLLRYQGTNADLAVSLGIDDIEAEMTVTEQTALNTKYPLEIIDYSLLVDSEITVNEWLNSVLNGLGAVCLIDRDRKIIELSTANTVRTGKILDLTNNIVSSYCEEQEELRRVYAFENKGITKTGDAEITLKKNLDVPRKTGLSFEDSAIHSLFESTLEEGLVFWKRIGNLNDDAIVGLVDNKTEHKLSISRDDNLYISDLFLPYENSTYHLSEYVIASDALYVSNTDDNTDSPLTEPLPDTWSKITDDAIIASSEETGDITLTIWRGRDDVNRKMVATSTKLDADGNLIAPDFDLQMKGDDGVFDRFLKYLDKWQYSDVEVFQLDGELDLDAVKELFSAQGPSDDFFRRFRVENMIYVPKQFNCVLGVGGIEQAQIKGVEV